MNIRRFLANLNGAIEEDINLGKCRNNIATIHHQYLFDCMINNTIEELQTITDGKINREKFVESVKGEVYI